jgi:diketogulonate reductase-like aldo/keto reductase
MVGLGSASGVKYSHVISAIEVGYRFVDTAQSKSWGYTEEDVGNALLGTQMRYEDQSNGEYVFVQTKIHPEDLGYESTKKMIAVSLDRLRVSSLDSILIHKPHCWPGACTREPEGTWHDSWVALMEAYDTGTVRSIGMCDIDEHLLDEMLAKRIGPHIIQNWFDPYHQDKVFRQRIQRHNIEHPQRRILYQGYSSLGTQWFHHKGYTENPVLTNPTLISIALNYGVSVPQVVIQWATRSGVMVLPASTSPDHQISNLNSFEFTLSAEEMAAIDDMDGNPPQQKSGRSRESHPDEVSLNFVNRAEGPVHIYWISDENEHVHVGQIVATGDSLSLTSYHGHAFVFKDQGYGDGEDVSGKLLGRHVVNRSLGSEQNYEIEDSSVEEL